MLSYFLAILYINKKNSKQLDIARVSIKFDAIGQGRVFSANWTFGSRYILTVCVQNDSDCYIINTKY